MRALLTIGLTTSLLIVGSPELRARTRHQGRVERITASAKIKRGRARRARTVATYRALRTLMWQRVEPLLAGKKGQKRLKRRLDRNVRRFIKWYRTRKVRRAGRRISVTLDVIVDMGALRQRLKQLRVRLKLPGVLLLAGCTGADPAKGLARGLRAAGIRVVAGAWTAAQRPALVLQALSTPAKALLRAREAHAVAVVLASCASQQQGKLPAAGVVGVRGTVNVVVVVPGKGGKPQTGLRVGASAFGHHADPKQAGRVALEAASRTLGSRLEAELAPRLPEGAARTLFVRLRGGLGHAEQLKLVRRMGVELGGVSSVKPLRFKRGETWIAVRTVHDPTGLRTTLAGLKAPTGYRITVSAGSRPGWIELKAELTEDS